MRAPAVVVEVEKDGGSAELKRQREAIQEEPRAEEGVVTTAILDEPGPDTRQRRLGAASTEGSSMLSRLVLQHKARDQDLSSVQLGQLAATSYGPSQRKSQQLCVIW